MSVSTTATTTSSATTTRHLGDSLLHGMVIALILTVVQRLSGLFRGVFLCWALDETSLGVWSLTQSWLFSLAPIAVLGLTGALRRYVELYRLRGQLSRYLIWTLTPAAALTFLATIVLWWQATWFSTVLFRSSELWQIVRLMAFALAATVIFNTTHDLAESFKLLRVASWMRLIHSVAFTVFAVAGLSMIGPTAQVITGAFFWATVVASVPGIFVARVWWFERHVQTGAPNVGEMWKRVGGFAAWLWILNIKSNLFEISDRYMVLLFAGGTVVDNQALVGKLHSSRLFPLLLLDWGFLFRRPCCRTSRASGNAATTPRFGGILMSR